jgi:cell division septation protein DedD
VQCGSFRKIETAEGEVQKLRENGFDAWWRRAKVPGKGEWFRIYVGKENTKDAAYELGRKLKKIGLINQFLLFKYSKKGDDEIYSIVSSGSDSD